MFKWQVRAQVAEWISNRRIPRPTLLIPRTRYLTFILQRLTAIPKTLCSYFSLNLQYLILAIAALTFLCLDLYLCSWVASLPDGTTLPVSVNSSETPCSISPYCYINVKLLMIEPMNFYIYNTISILVIQWLRLDVNYLSITPNCITVLHTFIALIAIFFLHRNSIAYRRIGVLMFSFRNFLDSLDGFLASARRKASLERGLLIGEDQYRNKEPDFVQRVFYFMAPEKLGYWMDGICDGIGFLCLFATCFLYLQKNPVRRNNNMYYAELPVLDSSDSKSLLEDGIDFSQPGIKWRRVAVKLLQAKRSGLLSVLYGFQTLIASIGWNQYVVQYSAILERSTDSDADMIRKSNLLHSPVMWFLIFSWRYICPHLMMEILLFATFVDKMGDFLFFVRYIGYAVVISPLLLSMIHVYFLTNWWSYFTGLKS